MLIIAEYSGARDTQTRRKELASWADLIAYLTAYNQHICTPNQADCTLKRNAEAWAPFEDSLCPEICHMSGTKSDCGGGKIHRLDANVQALHAVVFDADHTTTEELEKLTLRLKNEFGLAYILHATHSDDPKENGERSARLVLQLKEPFRRNPGESTADFSTRWRRLREWIESSIQLKSGDPRTHNPSRIFFRPGGPAPAPLFRFEDGIPIDASRCKNTPTTSTSTPPPITSSATTSPTPPRLEIVPPIEEEPLKDPSEIRSKLVHTKKPHWKKVVTPALNGTALAPQGGHDDALKDLATACSFLVPGADRGILRSMFWQSFVETAWGQGTEHMWSEFEKKLDRTLELARKRKTEVLAYDVRVQNELRRMSAALDPDLEGPVPDVVGNYTEEQITKWTLEQGGPLDKRWIVQSGSSLYVFENGRYKHHQMVEMDASLRRDLSRSGLVLVVPKADGSFRRMKTAEAVEAHGSVALKVISSFIEPRSRFDFRSEIFYEAVAPLRALTPKQHPEIQAWLELLGGKDFEALLNWVASVIRLDRQCCALYLCGPKSLGKTLLAAGLARLWVHGAYTRLESALGTFNEKVADCPLIFADEALPSDWNRTSVTALLRELIGSTQRELTRKYRPTATLLGAVRVIIAANNDGLLQTRHDMTGDDVAAMSDRVCFIECDPRAAAYLEKRGGPKVLQPEWIDGNKIAEHALWLFENRKFDDSHRFLVTGTQKTFHEALAVRSGASSEVCQWLALFLAQPVSPNYKNAAMIEPGLLLANGQGILDNWAALVKSDPPSLQSINQSLRNMQSSRVRVQRRTPSGVRWFYTLRVETVLHWAEQNLIGDFETMRARINPPTTPEKAP